MSTLHRQIMNLPAKPYDGTQTYDAYCKGHRDARHAAAELALKADAQIEALTAQRDELLAALEGILMHIGTGREDGVEWVCEPVHRDEIKAARAAIAKCKEAA